MELFKQMLLMESQKAAEKERAYTINIISKVYNEWKKTGRRKNAVDIVTTSVNKLSVINPATIPHLHDAAKLKLAIICMRCMDLPNWKPVESKDKVYKKLFPIIDSLQNVSPNSGTGANLRDVILTRLSACVTTQAKSKAFVSYEPQMPSTYLRYLFGEDKPKKTFRMQSLPLPEDFDTVISTLKINHQKAESKLDDE